MALSPGGTMPAAVYQGGGKVEVEQVPVPEPADDEVLIEVSHCGICGSDMHFVIEEWGSPGTIHGHEYSGVVVAAGAAVTAARLGDRVVGGPGQGCGQCRPCQMGSSNICVEHTITGGPTHTGAYAAYRLISNDSVYQVPASLELRTAALAEPVAVALRGVRRSGLKPGDRALVTGAGPIGMLTVAVLRALGIEDITVSEPHESRRALALAVGATRVLRPDEFEIPKMPMDIVDGAFHAAIECSGRADAMVTALSQLAKGGTLVLSGTGMIKPKIEAIRIIVNELTVTGSAEYTPAEFRDAIGLIDKLPTSLLIEEEDVPLSKVRWAMEQLASGGLAGKVMVVPVA